MSTVTVVFLGAAVYILAGWWLTGRFGKGPLEPPVAPDSQPSLSGEPGEPDAAIAFDTAVRGYRMDEVDAVVSRLREQVRAQAAEIARLRGDAASEGGESGSKPGDEPSAAVSTNGD